MMGNFIKYRFPVLLWMGFIYWMSTGTFSADETSRFIGPLLNFLFPHLSSGNIDLLHGIIRKAGHVTEYFILGLLLFRALRGGSAERWSLPWAVTAFLGVALYALADEYHQSWVSSRTASLVDVGFDSAGGALSQFAVLIRKKRCGVGGRQAS